MGLTILDYEKIGGRVRKLRKLHNLSQEELAEKIGISTTHMSHIETGNTKLSLSVLVDLTIALNVQAECLLFDRESEDFTDDDFKALIDNCNFMERNIIISVAKSVKTSLEKYLHL